MENELIFLFLKEIKSKNQIMDLEDKFVEDRLKQFFLKNGDIRKKLELEFRKKNLKIIRSKFFKDVVKSIRKEIGIIYGSFLTSNFNKRKKRLEGISLDEIKSLKLKSNLGCDDELRNLLELHKSTRERYDYYDDIYSRIFSWYKPNKIADIACGLNPISIIFMRKYLGKFPNYFASDLNPKDMDFLNLFFKKFDLSFNNNKVNNNLKNVDLERITRARAKAYNIVDLSILEDLEFQTCDLVFLFKAIDSFESIKKNISKDLILGIKAKKIVVSFPRKSLVSRKDFKDEKRNWFFNFLESKNFKYERFDIDNEMFILIEK